MSLSEVSISRPVLTLVMTLVIVIFGFVGYRYLGVREFPEMDPPVVTVTTVYTGANADVIRAQITDPLEEAINGIEGIRSITSVSTEQSSLITVEFNLNVDMDAGTNDVRDRVSKTLRLLPKDIDPPIVEKQSANTTPIILVILRSNTKNIMEVNDIAENLFKDRLQTIEGVGEVRVYGEKKYSMRLWLDPARMSVTGITSVDVRKAVNRENIEKPSGRVEGRQTELSIRTLGLLESPEEFNDMIIRQEDGSIIRLSDVGHAELYPENDRSTTRMEGQDVILLGVIPQHGANNIAIADEVYTRMDVLKKSIPVDYDVIMGYDFTTFERNAIKDVKQTIILSLCLVILIIFFFLRDWRSTLIPVVTIPVSLIGTFALMAIFGLSINVLSLLGVVLAIGLVCDDAILVLENIYTKIDIGMTPMEAAFRGMKEIYFAVISTTVTLAAVFLPVMFLEGLAGRLFREFALVVAGAVLISAFVALTLSPMMCSRLLTRQRHLSTNWLMAKTEPFFLDLNHWYRYSLHWFIGRRWLVFPIFGVVVFLIFFLGKSLHTELSPFEDRSNIRIPTLAPEGSTYEFTKYYMERLDKYLSDSIPEISSSFYLIAPNLGGVDNPNRAMQLVYLKEPGQRQRSQQQIYNMIVRDIPSITGIRSFPFQPPTIGSRFSGLPLQYVILAPSLDSLVGALPRFLEKAREIPFLRLVDADLKVNKPELRITIDRDRAAELELSVEDIASTLNLTLSGDRYGYFIMGGHQYEIIGNVNRDDRNRPSSIHALYVRNRMGEMIPMENVVTIEENINPASIFSYNRYISATVSAGLAPGYTLGDGINALDKVAVETLPPGFTTALTGQARDFRESSSSLWFVFVLALVLIFLVLAGQFESFIDPFIIMLTVPLAMTGALISLWYFNQTLNIFSEIGIIMLIGLVTKNGILIVEFANQRKQTGLDKREAVQRAAVSRLRPILMTSSAMILGILPIALNLGASAESRQSLGIAVVGGLIFSTFLTLYMVPAIYSYLSRNKSEKVDYTEITVEKKITFTQDIS